MAKPAITDEATSTGAPVASPPTDYAAAHPPRSSTHEPCDDEARLTAKGRATRERIVEAAARLVFQRGIAGTSIDDVRKAAGVSGSQMYHYFSCKDALVRAVVRREADAVLDVQEPALSQLDSFAGLRSWAAGAIRMQQNVDCVGGCSFGSIANELAETADDATRADIASGFSRWELKIRSGLQAMYDRGELRPEANPEELALGILAGLQGGLLMTEALRTTAPLEAVMNTVLSHVESFAA